MLSALVSASEKLPLVTVNFPRLVMLFALLSNVTVAAAEPVSVPISRAGLPVSLMLPRLSNSTVAVGALKAPTVIAPAVVVGVVAGGAVTAPTRKRLALNAPNVAAFTVSVLPDVNGASSNVVAATEPPLTRASLWKLASVPAETLPAAAMLMPPALASSR